MRLTEALVDASHVCIAVYRSCCALCRIPLTSECSFRAQHQAAGEAGLLADAGDRVLHHHHGAGADRLGRLAKHLLRHHHGNGGRSERWVQCLASAEWGSQ